MEFKRKASAYWEGSGEDGKGSISTESKVLDKSPYEFKTRFKEPQGTNPEELIGAAHSSCFTMQLSFMLGEKEYTPTSLNTSAEVHFKDGEIIKIALTLVGEVEGIDEKEFTEIAEAAKAKCPISKLFEAEITLSATLK